MASLLVDAARHRSAVTLDNVNPNLANITYVTQSRMSARVRQLEKELQQGVQKPFTEIIRANVGDCQAMGHPPITFHREVLALIACPALMDADVDGRRFASDVKERARAILALLDGGSIGSYTDKKGHEMIRRHVAEFIARRDGGIAADYRNVVLTAGATEAIKVVLKLLISEVNAKKSGVMVPVPNYPLYSATLGEYGMKQIDYYLDEDNEWNLDIRDLQRSVKQARKHCNPSAIVVINPGNPTGQVLSESNIQEIIRFAHEERLLILADEVYQDNVYAPESKFHSFKKVMSQMEAPYNKTELASFMSCSKGFMSECGARGGYVEIVNLLPEIHALFMKLTTTNTCPSVVGQALLECMVHPPQLGDASYDLYHTEKAKILRELAERAKLVVDSFNRIEGIWCGQVQGALYAFPKLTIPVKAIAKANQLGDSPDVYYALALLEKTGICVVPGAGYGQKTDTYHFRTTILPQPEVLNSMMDKICTFHHQFLEEHK